MTAADGAEDKRLYVSRGTVLQKGMPSSTSSVLHCKTQLLVPHRLWVGCDKRHTCLSSMYGRVACTCVC